MKTAATITRKWLGILVISILVSSPGWAQDTVEYEDFAELDLESLLNQTITSATKYEQKLSESPVAATVITAEEIAASGARNIPELLRNVPGMGVIQTGSSSYDVSARGMTKVGANTFLVMVDGRKVYLDLHTVTLWDQLPVNMEDIKSIEVVLGPGSVMYGANAFAGIINIITFTPDEKPGSTARLLASDLGESYGSVRHAGRKGNTSYKFNTTWDRSEDWESGMKQTEIARIDGTVRHDLGDDAWLSGTLGHLTGHSMLIASDTHLQNDGAQSHGRLDFRKGNLEARLYVNRLEMDLIPVGISLTGASILESHTNDFEIRHSFHLTEAHHLIYGGSYRHQRTSYSQQSEAFKTDIYAGFLHDEWHLGDKITISTGARYDHHPLVGGHWAPRGGLVFQPHPDHALRLSYGKAYRDPSFVETNWQVEAELMPGFNQIIRGDKDVNSEILESFEFGYQGMLSDRLLARLALFNNQMENIIDMGVLNYFPSPPAPPGLPMEIAFQNMHTWNAAGGEFSLRYDPWSWMHLGANYSYVWLENYDTEEHLPQVPVHRASFMANLKPCGGHQLIIKGRFTSDAVKQPNIFQPTQPYIDEHFEMDAVWNLQTNSDGRLTLGVYNIFDRRTSDDPLAISRRRGLRMSLIQDF